MTSEDTTQPEGTSPAETRGDKPGQGSPDRVRKHKRHGSRFKARRRAVDILFEAEFRDTDPVEIVEERKQLSRNPDHGVAPVPEYTTVIIPGVAENLDAIDEAITRHLSSDWRLDRIPAVDRQVLRVAAWEMLFNDDVPNTVATVEAVELASTYSHNRAPQYINAVLDGLKAAAEIAAARAAVEANAAAAEADTASEANAAATEADTASEQETDSPDSAC